MSLFDSEPPEKGFAGTVVAVRSEGEYVGEGALLEDDNGSVSSALRMADVVAGVFCMLCLLYF